MQEVAYSEFRRNMLKYLKRMEDGETFEIVRYPSNQREDKVSYVIGNGALFVLVQKENNKR